MADTTIKVDSQVRDRLAILAAEAGTTIRGLIEQWAAGVPTRAELAQRQAHDMAYVIANLRPDFNEEDLAAGKELWASIRTAGQAGPEQAGGGSTGQVA
jgi:hypothetical protein